MSSYPKEWLKRASISIDNLSGAGTIDAAITIPPDWDFFWDNVLASGDDIRVVDADGITTLDYQIAASPVFSVANKLGALDVNDYAAPNTDGSLLLWLMWDNPAASDAQGSFSPSGAKTGTIEVGCPAIPSVIVQSERPGDTEPRQKIEKAPSVEQHVWWDLESMLSKRCDEHNETDRYEEIDYVKFEVLDNVDAAQAAMFAESETRFVVTNSSQAWVRTTVKAGTDGQDYILSLTVGTTTGRILNPRVLLRVRKPVAS